MAATVIVYGVYAVISAATAPAVILAAVTATATVNAGPAEKQIQKSGTTAVTIITHLYFCPLTVYWQRFSPLPIILYGKRGKNVYGRHF